MKSTIVRTSTLAALAFLTTACAHGMPWSGGHAHASGEASLCMVRVENAYDEPIEAGARAGAEEVLLGTVDPDDTLEFGVPCSYRAVTVYRVVDEGAEGLRLSPRARALDPSRTTTVTLRPPAARGAQARIR